MEVVVTYTNVLNIHCDFGETLPRINAVHPLVDSETRSRQKHVICFTTKLTGHCNSDVHPSLWPVVSSISSDSDIRVTETVACGEQIWLNLRTRLYEWK